MDQDLKVQIFNQVKLFVQKNLLVVVLGCSGLILLVVGMIYIFAQEKETITFEEESADTDLKAEIMIDIEGAVINPGVYKMPQDSRLQDVLIKAGGLALDADREYLSKNINLAKRVNDGDKIYIPRNSDATSAQVSGSSTSITSDTISLNSATISQLDSLPGIGAVTAQKIIDNRPYNSIEELLEKKVVSKSVFEKIKEKITVY